MRNPSRKAAICAGLVPLAGGSFWLGMQRIAAGEEDWVAIALIAVAAMIFPFALVILIQALLFRRGMAKLLAGEGRVAEWHVTAVDWDKFRAFDLERMAMNPTYYVNDLSIRNATPPEGVRVLVGAKSLIVDGSYHVLRMNGLPELRSIGWVDNASTPKRPPDCLEFRLAYPRGRYGGIRYTSLRVPIPAEAFEAARKVYHAFAPALERRIAKGSIALRNPRRTLQVCGVLLLFGGGVGAWAWFEAERTGANLGDSEMLLVVLIISGAIAFFALLLGGLTLLLRSKKSD